MRRMRSIEVTMFLRLLRTPRMAKGSQTWSEFRAVFSNGTRQERESFARLATSRGFEPLRHEGTRIAHRREVASTSGSFVAWCHFPSPARRRAAGEGGARVAGGCGSLSKQGAGGCTLTPLV